MGFPSHQAYFNNTISAIASVRHKSTAPMAPEINLQGSFCLSFRFGIEASATAGVTSLLLGPELFFLRGAGAVTSPRICCSICCKVSATPSAERGAYPVVSRAIACRGRIAIRELVR